MPPTARKISRIVLWPFLVVGLLTAEPLWTLASGRAPLHGDWRTATHRSVGLPPDSAIHREAIVQVYAGRVFGWRGATAVQLWLAAKPKDAHQHTRDEVIEWSSGRGQSSVSIQTTPA